MPPSPSLRISPGREMRTDNHKRGRSLEGGLLVREKDEDLALFSEMQNRETDNFLLDSTDDFDDSLSTKLRYFSDFKLGVSIPARGESSELLNIDGDKNDYDWLLTPPDTPLFPSLDDDAPNLSHRGRPRSQPISITRSATTEKSNRASRSSASPHRLSPSPRSSSTTLQSRGRPLSASHSGSNPILRPTTPSRSPSRSTTPSKPSTPAPRSSSPTPRRLSTGSNVTAASSGRTGTSPVKTSRGNSASPKLRAWQASIPGFSTEAPPNLRTSLSDRPASYVRGSSPASRNGRGLSPTSSNARGLSPVSSDARGLSPASRNGRESYSKRQSMSPTASRSSSCSHDRDQFSSYSKGSVASSGDDDIDSLQSFNVSISDRSAVRKVGAFPSSRAQGLSKKPSRVLSSSAPKRSFDSALRQMDRRSPQNMFRPLLSSVPSTTFYAGKVTPTHRPAISRNSSITTSSNTSSEQGASFAPDIEGSDHDQDRREWGKVPDPDVQDEVSTFDKVDETSEGVGREAHDEEPIPAHECSVINKGEISPGVSESLSGDVASAVVSESTHIQNELLEADCEVITMTCSKCGRNFNVMDSIEELVDVCPDCIEKGGCMPLSIPEATFVTKSSTNSDLTKENEYFDELCSEELVPELPEFTSSDEAMLVQDETDAGGGKNLLSDSFLGKSIEEGKMHFVDQQVLSQVTDGSKHSNCDSVDQQLPPSNSYPSLMVDVPQGVGISVLLKKSSSSKWPVVQGRSFTASGTPLDDLSYARDSMNSMRSSTGHGSVSTSSSVDLGSSRQTDARTQRQLSCRKTDLENSRYATNRKPLSRGSSFSGISNHSHHAMAFDVSTSEENFDMSTGKMEFDVLEETLAVSEEKVKSAELDSLAMTTTCEENQLDCVESCGMLDSPGSEPLSDTLTIQLMDTSLATIPDENNRISSGNADEVTNIASISDEVSSSNQGPVSVDEDAKPNDDACGVDIVEDPPHDPSVTISGEVGTDHEAGSHNEENTVPQNPEGVADELQEDSVFTSSEKDALVSASESCIADHAHDILEESTVTIGVPGQNSRSLTLEEATDTILFCSSIIQNLAYQAASIGMEKEHRLSLEGSRPTVTLLGKSSPDRRDHGRSGSNNKRTPKSNKSRQKRVETTDVGSASPKTEADKITQRSVPHDLEVPNRVDSARPLKPESKCNCTVM